MSRNVEIKARVVDARALVVRVERVAVWTRIHLDEMEGLEERSCVDLLAEMDGEGACVSM
jgi:hypothetical protein